jgi:hypothetical protein
MDVENNGNFRDEIVGMRLFSIVDVWVISMFYRRWLAV